MSSTANENSANAANIAELDAHIKLAAQKLKTLQPTSEAYKENVELLEDYYERIVQIKNMRNETLEEIVRENEARYRFILRRWRLILLATCAVFALILWTVAPSVFVTVGDALGPFMTLDRVVTNTMLLAVVVYAGGRREY